MVVHKQDDPRVNITQLLETMRECKENQENNQRNHCVEYAKAYLPSMSKKNNYRDHYQNMHIQVNDNYLPLYVDYNNPDSLDQGDP